MDDLNGRFQSLSEMQTRHLGQFWTEHREDFPTGSLGIESAEVLLAETGKPDDAVLVHNHIMRRDLLARQIVFGVDHPCRPALWARQGF